MNYGVYYDEVYQMVALSSPALLRKKSFQLLKSHWLQLVSVYNAYTNTKKVIITGLEFCKTTKAQRERKSKTVSSYFETWKMPNEDHAKLQVMS